jgi:hypothetical protein
MLKGVTPLLYYRNDYIPSENTHADERVNYI